jgi:hypothetical protein
MMWVGTWLFPHGQIQTQSERSGNGVNAIIRHRIGRDNLDSSSCNEKDQNPPFGRTLSIPGSAQTGGA